MPTFNVCPSYTRVRRPDAQQADHLTATKHVLPNTSSAQTCPLPSSLDDQAANEGLRPMSKVGRDSALAGENRLASVATCCLVVEVRVAVVQLFLLRLLIFSAARRWRRGHVRGAAVLRVFLRSRSVAADLSNCAWAVRLFTHEVVAELVASCSPCQSSTLYIRQAQNNLTKQLANGSGPGRFLSGSFLAPGQSMSPFHSAGGQSCWQRSRSSSPSWPLAPVSTVLYQFKSPVLKFTGSLVQDCRDCLAAGMHRWYTLCLGTRHGGGDETCPCSQSRPILISVSPSVMSTISACLPVVA